MNEKQNIQLDDYWTKDAPYIVYVEELRDYYQDPPIRGKVAEFSSFIQALDCCREQIITHANEKDTDSVSYWVMPQPAGLIFNEHEFLEQSANQA